MSMSRLADRVVLITGAESGIGREVARRAAAEGAIIAAIGLDAAALESRATSWKGPVAAPRCAPPTCPTRRVSRPRSATSHGRRGARECGDPRTAYDDHRARPRRVEPCARGQP